jgi:hypothetical protein
MLPAISNHNTPPSEHANSGHNSTALTIGVPDELLEALAQRAAAIVCEQDRGFLDVDGAAAFLGGCTRKRIYHLVERGRLPHHRVAGRLLFDPRKLRTWIENGD